MTIKQFKRFAPRAFNRGVDPYNTLDAVNALREADNFRRAYQRVKNEFQANMFLCKQAA